MSYIAAGLLAGAALGAAAGGLARIQQDLSHFGEVRVWRKRTGNYDDPYDRRRKHGRIDSPHLERTEPVGSKRYRQEDRPDYEAYWRPQKVLRIAEINPIVGETLFNDAVARGMPYSKRRKYSKKPRKSYRKSKRKGFSTVSGSLYAPELKTFQGNSGAAGGLSLTPAAICLNALPQSTTAAGRIGRDVRYLSLEVTIIAGISSTVTAGTDYMDDHVRLLICWDSETVGAAPALSTLLNQQTGVTPYINSIYNTDNVNRRGCRFSVLCDTIFPIRPMLANNGNAAPNLQALGQTVKHFKCRIGKTGHFYNQSTPSVADILKGGLFAFVIGGGYNASPKGSFQLAWQLYYKDV